MELASASHLNENDEYTVKAKMRKYNSDIDIAKRDDDQPDNDNGATAVAKPTVTDVFPSGWMAQYAIVKSIFQLLPVKDLLSATSVCQYWCAVGSFVREKRRNLANVILWHPYSEQGRTKEAIEYFNDVQISEEVNQFMADANPSFIDVLDSDLSDEKYEEWKNCFWRDFTQQFSESQMVFFFATKSFAQYIQTRKKRFVTKKTEQEAFFGSAIPNSVPCVCAFGSGVGFTMPNSPNVYEMERQELPMVTGMLIPKVSGLTFRVITFDKNLVQMHRRRKSVSSENCRQILGISPEENVKGLIFMDADSHGRHANPVMEAALHFIRDNPTVCFAGGSVYYTLTSVSDEETNKQLGYGVVICGEDEVVKIGCVALVQPGITEENDNKLKRFQTLVSNGEDSFCFMFACNGRGAYMHNKEHVELTLFQKYYPNTPIIGIFTNGELGHEYLPGDNPCLPDNRGALEFTFSTIFLFVSYKHT